jgi:hypothetical protein
VGRACNVNDGTSHTKQRPATKNSQQQKSRKIWEDRVREDAVALCGKWASKNKAKDRENLAGNEMNRLRHNLGCITTAAVAGAHIT